MVEGTWKEEHDGSSVCDGAVAVSCHAIVRHNVYSPFYVEV